jgi:hypothetical protein
VPLPAAFRLNGTSSSPSKSRARVARRVCGIGSRDRISGSVRARAREGLTPALTQGLAPGLAQEPAARLRRHGRPSEPP